MEKFSLKVPVTQKNRRNQSVSTNFKTVIFLKNIIWFEPWEQLSISAPVFIGSDLYASDLYAEMVVLIKSQTSCFHRKNLLEEGSG